MKRRELLRHLHDQGCVLTAREGIILGGATRQKIADRLCRGIAKCLICWLRRSARIWIFQNPKSNRGQNPSSSSRLNRRRTNACFSMLNSTSDETFGPLAWDSICGSWSGTVAIPGGKLVKLKVGTLDEDRDQTITEKARDAFARVLDQQTASMRKAAADLLALHNEGWHHYENTPPLTSEQFQARLTVESIQVQSWGAAVVYFDDGDLFWGHSIRVEQEADGSFQTEAFSEG